MKKREQCLQVNVIIQFCAAIAFTSTMESIFLSFFVCLLVCRPVKNFKDFYGALTPNLRTAGLDFKGLNITLFINAELSNA